LFPYLDDFFISYPKINQHSPHENQLDIYQNIYYP